MSQRLRRAHPIPHENRRCRLVIVGQLQPPGCHLLHQLSGMVEIRLPLHVAIGAEIGVAAVGRGDHIRAQLEPRSKPYHSSLTSAATTTADPPRLPYTE